MPSSTLSTHAIGRAMYGPADSVAGVITARTRWQKGSVVEAAYILYSNHAGGYSYRLCKEVAG